MKIKATKIEFYIKMHFHKFSISRPFGRIMAGQREKGGLFERKIMCKDYGPTERVEVASYNVSSEYSPPDGIQSLDPSRKH